MLAILSNRLLVLYNYIYGNKVVITSLRSVATSTDNHNLVVPIQYGIAKSMPLIKRNALYTDGTLMIINSVVFTKVKWYEKSWFKFVVIIVMVVILVIVTIVSWGSGTGPLAAWYATLISATLGHGNIDDTGSYSN